MVKKSTLIPLVLAPNPAPVLPRFFGPNSDRQANAMAILNGYVAENL